MVIIFGCYSYRVAAAAPVAAVTPAVTTRVAAAPLAAVAPTVTRVAAAPLATAVQPVASAYPVAGGVLAGGLGAYPLGVAYGAGAGAAASGKK